ncbi:MAG: hypothetical protein KFF73_12945 [Cyclobacteriaceae bacterium]|nr:hypothetical protein [Cyclobacteriaceae bacterium]
MIGSAAGYFMAEMLMASIWTYYLPIGPTAFILSVLIMILVSAVTVGGKVINTASLNPAYTLRNE